MPIVTSYDQRVWIAEVPTLDWSNQFTSTSLVSSLEDYYDEEALLSQTWTYYVTGSGFSDTNGDGYADAGTVTSIIIHLEDVPYLWVSGLNWALSDLYAIPYFEFMRTLLSESDTISGSPRYDVVQGWGGGDSLYGGAGNDRLISGSGDDLLDGGAGLDEASYEDASAGVTVSLRIANAQNTGGAGSDTLVSIENLRGSAFGDVLIGDAGANELLGLAGNDILNGGTGDDEMWGGAGDDTFYVDSSGDRAFEYGGQGTDLVYSSLSFSLTLNLENLILTGTAVGAYGNSSANRLVGNSANNIIDGGAGADVMRGGLGDDRYYVDNAGDRVIESSGEGNDRVYSSISYSLTGNVEMLVLTGTAFRGNGTTTDNTIIGNVSNNRLNGGQGEDVMRGGDGDDVYFVDNIGDRVVELSGEGRDRVYSTISYQLDNNAEDLFLRGSSAINGSGNALDNMVIGNSGANILTGGAGADDLRGGGGIDRFHFRDGDFAGMTASTCDRIIDFSQAQGDLIKLNQVDANTLLADDQRFAFIGTDDFTGAAGELRYKQAGGNTYVYGDTNGDGAADFMIRVDGLHSFVEGDFVL